MKKLGLLIGFICLSGVVFAAPQAQEHFSLFPNPVTQGEVSVTSEKPINKVEVLSIVGVVLFEETVETINEVELTLQLHPGVYLMRVHFEDDTQDIKRFWVN